MKKKQEKLKLINEGGALNIKVRPSEAVDIPISPEEIERLIAAYEQAHKTNGKNFHKVNGKH